jgi:predicted kinase
MAPILYIPVGIPGCGKSTMFNRLNIDNRVSTDAARIALGREPGSVDQEVFDTYHAMIRSLLSSGRRSVYADATNLRNFAREELLGIAQDAGAETHLILFRNLGEAILRNSKRTGTEPGEGAVPHEAMLRMIEQYERALLDIPGEVYTYVTEVSSVR